MGMSDVSEAAVREAELQRCRALVEGDFDTIAALIRDDVVHVHATGMIDDKAAYLDGLKNRIRFEQADRRELKIRVFGDTAVANGLLDQGIVNRQTGKRTDATFTTTQVWVKGDSAWLQVSFHASRPQ